MTTRQFIRMIAAYYGATVIFRRKNDEWFVGLVDVSTRVIELFPHPDKRVKTGEQQYLSTFFHELGHLYCRELGIYKRYHSGRYLSDGYLRKYAYKAEVAADKYGEMLMNAYLPDMKFESFYRESPRAAKNFIKVSYGL